MTARFVPAVVTMFTVYFYTNNVDPEQYGLFSKVTAASGILYPLIFAPIWYYILRYRLENGLDVLKNSYSVFWLISGSAVLLGIVLKVLSTSQLIDEIVAIILMMVLFGNIQIRLEHLRIDSRPNRYLCLATSRSLLILLLAYLFVKYNIKIFISPLVDSTLFGIFACVLPYDLQSIKLVKISDFFSSVKIIYKFGFFLAIYSVFNTALFSIDRVLIGYIQSDYTAGLYSSSYDLATKIIHTIVFALELSMLPALLKVKNENGDIKDQFEKNTKTFVFVMIPVVIGLLAAYPALTSFYFPTEYRDTALIVFPIVVLSTFIGGFSNAIFYHSYLLRDQNFRLFKTIGFVLFFNISLNIVVNYFDRPLYSAYVALISFAIYGILTYRHTKEYCGYVFPLGFTGSILALSAPMLIFGAVVGYSHDIKIIAVEILISVVSYFLGCYLFDIYGMRGLVNQRLLDRASS